MDEFPFKFFECVILGVLVVGFLAMTPVLLPLALIGLLVKMLLREPND